MNFSNSKIVDIGHIKSDNSINKWNIIKNMKPEQVLFSQQAMILECFQTFNKNVVGKDCRPYMKLNTAFDNVTAQANVSIPKHSYRCDAIDTGFITPVQLMVILFLLQSRFLTYITLSPSHPFLNCSFECCIAITFLSHHVASAIFFLHVSKCNSFTGVSVAIYVSLDT